ncbi:Putative fluoride ion transporter CrcB [Mycolicibacterium aubagnense]
MSFTNCLVVMIGGALGTLGRYFVSWLALPISGQLPWGTIIINVSGSLLIGFFATLTLAQGRYPVSEALRLFVMIGICGGYTTFSSFSLQTLDLLRSGALVRAAVNIAASVALCTAAVAAGHMLASWFNGGEVRIAQVALEEDA